MKIGLCGTMSTGKTTIVKALQEHEFFKDKNYNFHVERSKHLMSLGIPLNQKSTYKGQLVFNAERASELMNPNMITDRTVIDVYAFSKASKDIYSEQFRLLGDIKESMIEEYDIIFYVPITNNIPMENNGVRETNEDYRRKIDNIIKEEFVFYKGNKHWLQADNLEERIHEIVNILTILEGKK